MGRNKHIATYIQEAGDAAGRVLALTKEKGLIRTRDVEALGIRRMILTRLCRKGRLKRIGRGLYIDPEADLTENHAFAEVCKRVPHCVICLLSALRFHELTTQSPFEVWIAIGNKARRPRLDGTPLRVVRFSGSSLTYGVEECVIEGVSVKITTAAKTVADCFKYRNKIGIDIAIEALRDYRRKRRSMDDLWRAAEVCRVKSVMRPYIEATV